MGLHKNKKLKVRKITPKEEIWYCPDCDWEQCDWEIEHPSLHKDVSEDREKVTEYCEQHMISYSHTSCKPNWCTTCGYLIGYVVVVGKSYYKK